MKKVEYKEDFKTWLLFFLLVFMGLSLRLALWIYPTANGHLSLITYDIYTYSEYGMAYIEGIRQLNFTYISSLNVGVPPLGMFLTGLTIAFFHPLLDIPRASFIAPIVFSFLTSIAVFFITKEYSTKAALLATALFSLDPFLIQFSIAYLDAIGTFFFLLSTHYVTKAKKGKDYLLAVVSGGLAVLTKMSFLVFIFVLSVFLFLERMKNLNKILFYSFSSAAFIVLNPWIWNLETLQKGVEGNIAFNSLPLSSIFGPFEIGVPFSIAWYILSYSGMGQVAWQTLPFLTPLALLVILIWRFMKKDVFIPKKAAIPAVAVIMSIFLLPRNFWTYSWGGGTLQGVLVRQFYQYYFYPYGPFLAILSAAIANNWENEGVKSRLLTYPITLVAILSPLAVVMNLGMPYWDFIFTLIYSMSQGSFIAEGLTATTFTAALLAASIISGEIIYRRLHSGASA